VSRSLSISNASYSLRIGALTPRHLRVTGFTGKEALNALYRFDVSVVARIEPELFERAVLGRRGTFALGTAGKHRFVNGIVSSLRAVARVQVESEEAVRYEVRLVPQAWLLGQRRGSRIFQKKTLAKVIDEVLGEHQVRSHWDLEEALPEREHCTQYRESDWQFVRRLCAENGILFYFQQPPPAADDALISGIEALDQLPAPISEAVALGASESGAVAETIVFTDSAHYPPMRAGSLGDHLATASSASRTVGQVELGVELESPAVRMADSGQSSDGEGFMSELSRARSIRPTRVVFRDYDPLRPRQAIESSYALGDGLKKKPAVQAKLAVAASASRLSATPGLEVGAGPRDALAGLIEPKQLEVYEHDGADLFPHRERSEKEADRMRDAWRRDSISLQGSGTCFRIEAGHRFAIEEHPVGSFNAEYVATAIVHHADGGGYRNEVCCVPADVTFVPRRPKPRCVQACLTATVVGAHDEEIAVNERAEIKVKFHFDRRSGKDDSSCWIRVLQPWAGPGWGFHSSSSLASAAKSWSASTAAIPIGPSCSVGCTTASRQARFRCPATRPRAACAPNRPRTRRASTNCPSKMPPIASRSTCTRSAIMTRWFAAITM
jgi:uncharacterized protein involved in type VI secretion and phage assembly